MFDLHGKNVLITGGTGSFGRKCAEILLREYNPERVIIFSRDELKQHEMRTSGFDQSCFRYFIGDVRDIDSSGSCCFGRSSSFVSITPESTTWR